MEASPAPLTARRKFLDRGRLIRWSLFLVSLLPLWLGVSFLVARQLTRRPHAVFEEPTPRVNWAKFRSIRLETSDGQKLGAWYADATKDTAPSVVLLHGNGGQRGHMLPRAELLATLGCALLPVTLRAHGESTGEINDIGYSARQDVIAAVEFLERERPGRPILIQGASMGAAAAAFASDKLGSRVAGYILEAPYLDLKSAVRNRTRGALPIGLEWVAYQGLITVAPIILPDFEKISPRDAISGIPETVPILIITGAEDRKATLEQVEAIFDRVRSHAKLVVFPKAGHLHYHETDPALYESEILDFVLKRSRNAPADSTSSNTSQ